MKLYLRALYILVQIAAIFAVTKIGMLLINMKSWLAFAGGIFLIFTALFYAGYKLMKLIKK